jgi:hypothetical protein
VASNVPLVTGLVFAWPRGRGHPTSAEEHEEGPALRRVAADRGPRPLEQVRIEPRRKRQAIRGLDLGEPGYRQTDAVEQIEVLEDARQSARAALVSLRLVSRRAQDGGHHALAL